MSSGNLLGVLASDFTEPVRDPLWGNIFLSPPLERLASSPPFAKLGRIKQLGPAYLVYPGATHSRRAHSLGVFHMARRLVWSLAARGYLDFVSETGLRSYLVAALCHDLGHFPYAHSLKELPLEEHEALTARELRSEPLKSLVLASGADPEAAAAIVDKSRPLQEGSEGLCVDARELRFFRSLLSGVLDPDKLDYLSRDAFFCGVPYGIQDCDFILQRVAVDSSGRLAIEERGIMSVESLLFSKYLMYRSVYWHRGVRSATAMMKKAVLLALRSGELKPEELYGLDDELFAQRLRSRAAAFPPFALGQAVLEGRLYSALLDLPFDESKGPHARLLDLDSRLEAEEELAAAARLDPLDLVIDLPEAISFETELPVLMPSAASGRGMSLAIEPRSIPFLESPTVFAPPVVASFARSLRRLRVFCREMEPGSAGAARLAEASRAMFG